MKASATRSAKKSAKYSPKSELSAYLLPLVKACPLNESNPEDCLLSCLQKMKPTQRAQWLGILNEDELAFLSTYHHVCLSTKIGLPPI
jgi:hypothetical protein